MPARSESQPEVTPGDRVVIHGHRQGEPERDGEILEVRGEHGAPPYLVRWDDGRVTVLYPSSDTSVQHFEHKR